MSAIIVLLVLGLSFYLLAVPPLLGVSLIILSLPLLVIPTEPVLGFGISFTLSFIVLFLSVQRLTKKDLLELGKSGLFELLLLAPLFVFLKKITSQWTEFYNIGEHIRDFAILSAVARDPVFTKDPWLDSLNLYYYTYWYRFGYLVKKLFDYSTAETYHFLICFILAFLFVLVLRVCRTLMKFDWKQSLFVTSITVFGSNILGLMTACADGFWWGPSRAVSAGITEFPSWSFVLGDLHPHYLSLIFLPILLLVAAEQELSISPWKKNIIPVSIFLWAATCFVYGANSWDVVGYAILTIPVLAAIYFGPSPKSAAGVSLLGYTLCLAIGVLALLLSPRMGGNPLVLKRLAPDSPMILPHEFFMHWGIQFISLMMGLAIAYFKKDSFAALFLFLIPIGIITYFGSTVLILLGVLTLALGHVWHSRRVAPSLALCIGSILVLTFTELFYFDDTYSGINERLNTIFKLYYFCWIPLSLGALAFLCEQLENLPAEFRSPYLLRTSAVTIVVLMLAFFGQLAAGNGGRSVILPHYIEPRIEGLSSVDQEVPGSAYAIKDLRTLPSDLRILERAEPAYSSSANLCSLSDHNCYIGWRNHLLLQYKDGLGEYDRRENISKQIYLVSACQEKRKLALSEKIGAVVLGPREKEIYPAVKDKDFECFPKSRSFGKINLYLP